MPAFIVIIIRSTSINIYNKNKHISEFTTEFSEEDIPVEVDFFENIYYEQLINVISKLSDSYKDILFFYIMSMDFLVKKYQNCLILRLKMSGKG